MHPTYVSENKYKSIMKWQKQLTWTSSFLLAWLALTYCKRLMWIAARRTYIGINYHVVQYSPAFIHYHVVQYSPAFIHYHVVQYSPAFIHYHVVQYSPAFIHYHVVQYSPAYNVHPINVSCNRFRQCKTFSLQYSDAWEVFSYWGGIEITNVEWKEKINIW